MLATLSKKGSRTLKSTVRIILIVFACSAISCRKGVPFVPGKAWTPAEQASLGQLPSECRPAHADAYAGWSNGAVRHVYLNHNGIISWWTECWTIYVFDGAGQLIEHNQMSTRENYQPQRLLSVSPLRVGFSPVGHQSAEEVSRLLHTRDEWQQFTNRMISTGREARARWQSEQNQKNGSPTNK